MIRMFQSQSKAEEAIRRNMVEDMFEPDDIDSYLDYKRTAYEQSKSMAPTPIPPPLKPPPPPPTVKSNQLLPQHSHPRDDGANDESFSNPEDVFKKYDMMRRYYTIFYYTIFN